jgi:hypothetical protein
MLRARGGGDRPTCAATGRRSPPRARSARRPRAAPTPEAPARSRSRASRRRARAAWSDGCRGSAARAPPRPPRASEHVRHGRARPGGHARRPPRAQRDVLLRRPGRAWQEARLRPHLLLPGRRPGGRADPVAAGGGLGHRGAIDLPVRRERQALEPHERRRHEVARYAVGQERAQRRRGVGGHVLAGEVGDEPALLGAASARDHGRLRRRRSAPPVVNRAALPAGRRRGAAR